MKLWGDFCWWVKHATWAQIDRLVAWVIDRNNRYD